MEFQRGDRVRMLKHADWKNEAVGTVISLYARPVTLHDGSPDLLYAIEFDEPQRDFTDELNGLAVQIVRRSRPLPPAARQGRLARRSGGLATVVLCSP
jgi:hypothetical protein